jgi:hypothetical protein
MELPMDDEIPDAEAVVPPAPAKVLTPAAQRALAEAEGGRGGLEPGRYGDWEIKGLTSDF